MTVSLKHSSAGAPTRAASGDGPEISNLARKAFEHYVPVMNAIPVPMSADYSAMIREHEVWVLRDDDAIVASLVLIWHPDHLLLESVAVDPDCQGSGYGRKMLDWALKRAKEASVPEIRLYTNILMVENRDWYLRAGFVETHEEQRGDKHIVHMIYRL
ncbi:GNAT family N-acetyltransferase [uncultured Roseibium sp.]|uniref:GNAT family N-acetyltransferase n=1 Tax=uncultured Roseibium sp. TaxID=1936171 RepID=UPI002622D216|nr:GNAT family N-acetyltransferase [uncultured Roseibium sp.]